MPWVWRPAAAAAAVAAAVAHSYEALTYFSGAAAIFVGVGRAVAA